MTVTAFVPPVLFANGGKNNWPDLILSLTWSQLELLKMLNLFSSDSPSLYFEYVHVYLNAKISIDI